MIIFWADWRASADTTTLKNNNFPQKNGSGFSSIPANYNAAASSLNVMPGSLNSHIKNNSIEVSEQYLIDVSNLIPSVFIGLDRECDILHLNNAAEKFLSCHAQDVIGKHIQQLIPELEPYMELIHYALETKEFKTFNKIKISLNKVEHFLKIVAYPFEKTGVTLYIDDITERVFMENLLVQTEKLTTLGTLAAGMAHEINNALSGVLQSVQNVTRRIDPNNQKNIQIATEHEISLEQVHKYLEVRGINSFLTGIRELGEHASVVVKNVLKFSRRSDYEMLAVDINSVVQDTLSIITTDYNLKKQLKDKKLIINTELAANIQQVYCVPSEIEQVLINLIKNSAHAVTEKTFVDEVPTITIRTKSKDNTLILEVADNGPGIAEQLRQHLFQPFFTTKPVGVGTGLGLSISHYIIVDKHYGTIEVESVVGQGATFIIELPFNSANPKNNKQTNHG